MTETEQLKGDNQDRSIERRIASRGTEILDFFNGIGEKLWVVQSPAPGNFNFLEFRTDPKTGEDYFYRAYSRHWIERDEQGNIVRFWPFDAHMTFEYSKKKALLLEARRDLVVSIGVEFTEDYSSGRDVSTEKPIKKFVIRVEGQEAGKQVIDYPQVSDSLSHTSEETRYSERIDNYGGFVVKVDLTGEQPKIVQYSDMIMVTKEGEENYHEGGTDFGIQVVHFALKAAKMIVEKADNLISIQ